MIALSEATQKEVASDGIQVTSLAPGLVDTAMTEWAREGVEPKEMIKPEDIAESVRMLLRTSPNCQIPEIVFARTGAGDSVPF